MSATTLENFMWISDKLGIDNEPRTFMFPLITYLMDLFDPSKIIDRDGYRKIHEELNKLVVINRERVFICSLVIFVVFALIFRLLFRIFIGTINIKEHMSKFLFRSRLVLFFTAIVLRFFKKSSFFGYYLSIMSIMLAFIPLVVPLKVIKEEKAKYSLTFVKKLWINFTFINIFKVVALYNIGPIFYEFLVLFLVSLYNSQVGIFSELHEFNTEARVFFGRCLLLISGLFLLLELIIWSITKIYNFLNNEIESMLFSTDDPALDYFKNKENMTLL